MKRSDLKPGDMFVIVYEEENPEEENPDYIYGKPRIAIKKPPGWVYVPSNPHVPASFITGMNEKPLDYVIHKARFEPTPSPDASVKKLYVHSTLVTADAETAPLGTYVDSLSASLKNIGDPTQPTQSNPTPDDEYDPTEELA